MNFWLTKVGATFQRAMDFAFKDLINKIIVVCMDNMTIFSKKREDHVKHVIQVL